MVYDSREILPAGHVALPLWSDPFWQLKIDTDCACISTLEFCVILELSLP